MSEGGNKAAKKRLKADTAEHRSQGLAALTSRQRGAATWICFLLPVVLPFLVSGSDSRASLEMMWWKATTAEYQQAAFRALLQAANRIALDEGLRENLPIKEADVVEKHISTPFWSDKAGFFGSLSTTNYHYFASCENRLSSVVRNFGQGDVLEPDIMAEWRQKFSRPKTSIDTNSACSLARKMLLAARVDVDALDRDSTIQVEVPEVGDGFIPIYYVRWLQPYTSLGGPAGTSEDFRAAASVQLLEPERRLLQMTIEKGKYLRGDPLSVPARDDVLMRSADPRSRELWATSAEYKQAALEFILLEGTSAARQLGLAEDLPLSKSNLRRTAIETPFISRSLGTLGSISTSKYVYAAASGNKLSIVSALYDDDEPGYLYSLKTRFTLTRSRMDTNTPYRLATNWLAAFSVDIAELERDYDLLVFAWDLNQQLIVPLYTVRWTRRGSPTEVVTAVELELPGRTLRRIEVKKSELLRRQPFRTRKNGKTP